MTGNPWTVNWQSNENEISADISFESKKKLLKFCDQNFESHVFIRTSGSTGFPKWVAISKKALLSSAKSVNQSIDVKLDDKWICPLSYVHMGGLSILARAFLKNNEVISFNESWNPQKFVENIEKTRSTLSSLVPTQLHDIVANTLKPPSCLKAVFVGGGYTHKKLYLGARELGWPILPSYGLSEAGSQVATASLESLKSHEFPDLEILPHLKVEVNESKNIVVSGSSLFSAYIFEKEESFEIKKAKSEYFVTEDKGEIYVSKKTHKFCLMVLGRDSGVKKVSGVLVNSFDLQKKWSESHSRGVVMLVPDSRLENRVALIIDKLPDSILLKNIQDYNSQLKKEETITVIYSVKNLPQTNIGKINTPAVFQYLKLNQ